MLSFTTIVTFLMSAMLAFAGVIPPTGYQPPAAQPPVEKSPQGAVVPPAVVVPPAPVVPATPAVVVPPATVVGQITWECPPDQGLFKFQAKLGTGSPMHCEYKLGGMPYYCDYNLANGKLIYNINDVFCPPSAVASKGY